MIRRILILVMRAPVLKDDMKRDMKLSVVDLSIQTLGARARRKKEDPWMIAQALMTRVNEQLNGGLRAVLEREEDVM